MRRDDWGCDKRIDIFRACRSRCTDFDSRLEGEVNPVITGECLSTSCHWILTTLTNGEGRVCWEFGFTLCIEPYVNSITFVYV
jgi:hypothetical protein